MLNSLPDPQQLVAWRAEYPNIYTCEVGDYNFVFRALTLEEITIIDLDPDATSVDKEDVYVDKCVLYPTPIPKKLKAGHVTQLSNYIENVSGINEIDFILDSFENEREVQTSDILIMMKCYVLTAMPVYSEEDLDKLTIKELIHKTVLAEQILTLRQTLNGIPTEGVQLRIVPREDAEAPQQAPQKKRDVSKEELLKRIRHEDKIGSDTQRVITNEYKKLADFDEDLLYRASVGATEEDPIARKLRQSMGR